MGRSRYPALRPMQGKMWQETIRALNELGSVSALLAWLPSEQSLGGKASAAAALLGNLAQVAGACLVVRLLSLLRLIFVSRACYRAGVLLFNAQQHSKFFTFHVFTGHCMCLQDKELQPDVASSAAHFVSIAGWLLSVLPLQKLFDTGHAMVEDADDGDDVESMPTTSAQQSGMRVFVVQSYTSLSWWVAYVVTCNSSLIGFFCRRT